MGCSETRRGASVPGHRRSESDAVQLPLCQNAAKFPVSARANAPIWGSFRWKAAEIDPNLDSRSAPQWVGVALVRGGDRASAIELVADAGQDLLERRKNEVKRRAKHARSLGIFRRAAIFFERVEQLFEFSVWLEWQIGNLRYQRRAAAAQPSNMPLVGPAAAGETAAP